MQPYQSQGTSLNNSEQDVKQTETAHTTNRDSAAHDPTMNSAVGVGSGGFRGRRALRYGFGGLWLVDALLQMQPGMFHPAFYGHLPSNVMPSILQTVAEGSVSWMQPVMSLTETVFTQAPVLMNTLIIVVQLLIAGLLLLPVPERFIKFAAGISVLWGLAIWVFGEGLGGLFSMGDMNFYAGFPGSALIYAVAGFLLLVPVDWWKRGLAQQVVKRFIAGLFILCAVLQVLPAEEQWSVKGQLDVFANSSVQPQPGFLAAPMMSFTNWVSTSPVVTNIILTVLLVIAAIFVLQWNTVPQWSKILVFVWLGWTWWFGQDFGFLFSGLSTDPNTALALAVLLLSITRRSITHNRQSV